MPAPRAGELQDWIRVESQTPGEPGATGQPAPVWSTRFEGWGRVEAISGSLQFKAEQASSRVRYMVTVPEPLEIVELRDRIRTEAVEGELVLCPEFVRREPRRRYVEVFCSRADARAG